MEALTSILRVFLRLVVVVILAIVTFPADCQSRVTRNTAIPDYVVYNSFFFRVNWLNDLADKLASQGKDAVSARTFLSRQAGLTPQESDALKAVALDWRSIHLSLLTSARVLTKTGVSAGDARLQSLADESQQTDLDHISQLQSALGPTRFKQLDVFVRATSAVVWHKDAADTANRKTTAAVR
jgi:hypothetical protein